MLLTKIWAAILACLATAFLAGMFLLSFGTAGGFTEADRAALQATTEAGVAALAAEIQASPVSRAPAMLQDPSLKLALFPPPVPPKDGTLMDVPSALSNVANTGLLQDHPQMTVALFDSRGAVIASHGAETEKIVEVSRLPAYANVKQDQEAQFSATLGGSLEVVKVSEALTNGTRLVAIHPLDLGATSFFRQILGTRSPAALIRGNAPLENGTINAQNIGDAFTKFATEHGKEAPPVGASVVHRVGEGTGARIGSVGRVPGPAGTGDDGTVLVVLSDKTAAAGQKELLPALREATNNGMTGEHWLALVFVLALSLALALYLPNMEITGPLQRLTAEFNAMRNGTQQQLFYDTYGNGPVGELAKAAHQYHEALRSSLQANEGVADEGDDKNRVSRRMQAVNQTRSNRRVPPGRTGAAQVPDAPIEEAPTTAHPSVPVPAAGAQGGRGPGFFTMPATKPLRSRETVIGNLMTLDNDPSQPEPAKDDAVREAYYQEVFEEFVKFKVENNESIDNFTYDKFATKLRANTAELMKRPDVKDVQFSVYIKDGKVALKARVVRG
ncbi:MAG TPA: MXAN_5187 family protein [Nannocystis sp.]